MFNVCRTDFPLKCLSKNKRGKEKWNFYHPKTLQLELSFFFPRRTRAFLLNDRKMSRLKVESEKDVSREKSETRVFIESMCVTVYTMYFGFDDLMGAQRAYEKLLTRQWSNQSVYKQILEERKNLFIRPHQHFAQKRRNNSASLQTCRTLMSQKALLHFTHGRSLWCVPRLFLERAADSYTKPKRH